MHRRLSLRTPILHRVSTKSATSTSPVFLTPVRTGLGEPEGDGNVTEIAGDRLPPTDARALTRRLDDIAAARLRARAASRHKFVG